ncbi:hypothetical protein HanHA300_Chr03g0080741 [Helianthus annuus]|nr:hypothetical protein HanHA300_Chr03g0080741 [Helianthus annuus]KAJ0767117.1 hypothetical protein HanLR1_Chr03g0085411 [Helianthus annuus]
MSKFGLCLIPNGLTQDICGVIGEVLRTRSESFNLNSTRSESIHVTHNVPFGDSPYIRAKNVQLVEKDAERALIARWRRNFFAKVVKQEVPASETCEMAMILEKFFGSQEKQQRQENHLLLKSELIVLTLVKSENVFLTSSGCSRKFDTFCSNLHE